MRLLFAGTTASEEFFIAAGLKHRLMSYADILSWAKNAFEYWINTPTLPKFFLDSGAYGAFTRGAVIDLNEYCDYIQQHQSRLNPYAALDVIGNYRGSARNYDMMLSKGLHPVPCFHMGSPDHELRRLLAMTDYLALGGVVGAQEKEMHAWLDRCFRIIKDFWPKRVHIFGVMSQNTLERYPFYSADSSGAFVGAGMGRVSTFEKGAVVTRPWVEYAHTFFDGVVMDGISQYQAKKGSAHRGRSLLNIRAQLQLQQHITNVWTQRGVTWEEPCAVSTAPSANTLSTPAS